MTEISTLREKFETRLESYLHSDWNDNDVKFYLHSIKYKIDLNAVNKNLEIPMRDFVLRGGKRIRPMLFLVCVELFGDRAESYLDYAVAIELIHNGTLVLDDIEDSADLRRGKPTCHKKFGLDTAVNVGASLHILPLNIIFTNKLPLSKSRKLIDIYKEELTNVSFGQALDIYWHKHHPKEVSEEEYLEMVRLKTGSLMRMSTRFASALTNRSEKTELLFKQLGENLGIAFQIIDDCLDLDAQSVNFGKSFGNDITEGKLSLPVIKTLKNASKTDSLRLSEILQKHTRDKQLISEAITLINKYGAITESRQFAHNIVMDTWNELESKWSKRNNLSNLRELSLFFVKRDH